MVQAVLIYGLEMWIMMLYMVRTLGAIYYRVAHQIKAPEPW